MPRTVFSLLGALWPVIVLFIPTCYISTVFSIINSPILVGEESFFYGLTPGNWVGPSHCCVESFHSDTEAASRLGGKEVPQLTADVCPECGERGAGWRKVLL